MAVPEWGSQMKPRLTVEDQFFLFDLCIPLVSQAGVLFSRPALVDHGRTCEVGEAGSSDEYSLKKNVCAESAREEMSEKTLVFVCICHLKKEPISKSHFLLP